MFNVNCTSFRAGGKCAHQAAPRRLFGPARCIVYMHLEHPPKDLRLCEPVCALCTPQPRRQPPRGLGNP